MSTGVNIPLEEKKAGQSARRKLRRDIHRAMYDMVSVGRTKGKAGGEKSLDTTTISVVMERDGSGLDALRISIPRHGLIHQQGWTPKGGSKEYKFPYLIQALYETDTIKLLASELAEIRGNAIVDAMVRGFPKQL